MKPLNIRVLEKLRHLASNLARPDPNPYQHEPYSFEVKEKQDCLALADEFEKSLAEKV